MSETRVPFNYDKYAADPDSWLLFTADNDQVVFVIETTESDVYYPLKGIMKSPEGRAEEATWTKKGYYVIDDTESLQNITHMIAVHKVKPVETIKVTSSLTPRLRNIYYNSITNSVVMSAKTHETWIEAMEYASQTCLHKKNLEHLCISTLEEHPQIREVLIAKGLVEVVVDLELEEIEA